MEAATQQLLLLILLGLNKAMLTMFNRKWKMRIIERVMPQMRRVMSKMVCNPNLSLCKGNGELAMAELDVNQLLAVPLSYVRHVRSVQSASYTILLILKYNTI